MTIEAFADIPPTWTQSAVHALHFHCPSCHASSREATQVWLNRRSPVYDQYSQKKWQEFYQCHCNQAWWAWSDDRPQLTPKISE